METIRITKDDLRTLEKLRLKRRFDCIASFSVNEKREIWMYVTRGWTKVEMRRFIKGQCPVVERIVELYLLGRPEGGRIFLKRSGLFYREFGVGSDVLFANTEFPG